MSGIRPGHFWLQDRKPLFDLRTQSCCTLSFPKTQFLLQHQKNIYVVVFLFKQRFQFLYGGTSKSACHNLGARITLPPYGNKDFSQPNLDRNISCQRTSQRPSKQPPPRLTPHRNRCYHGAMVQTRQSSASSGTQAPAQAVSTWSGQAREQAVQRMFTAIAGVYDLNNTLLSFGLHYHCLLYTSPSPRDRTRYRMPSSA